MKLSAHFDGVAPKFVPYTVVCNLVCGLGGDGNSSQFSLGKVVETMVEDNA